MYKGIDICTIYKYACELVCVDMYMYTMYVYTYTLVKTQVSSISKV